MKMKQLFARIGAGLRHHMLSACNSRVPKRPMRNKLKLKRLQLKLSPAATGSASGSHETVFSGSGPA